MRDTIRDMTEDLNLEEKNTLINWLKIAQSINNQGCTEAPKTISHFLIKPKSILVKCLGASNNYPHFVNKGTQHLRGEAVYMYNQISNT